MATSPAFFSLKSPSGRLESKRPQTSSISGLTSIPSILIESVPTNVAEPSSKPASLNIPSEEGSDTKLPSVITEVVSPAASASMPTQSDEQNDPRKTTEQIAQLNLSGNDSAIDNALLQEGVSESHIRILRARQALTNEPITEIMRSSEYGFLTPEGVARVLANVAKLEYFTPLKIDTVPALAIAEALKEHGIAEPAKFEGVLPVDLVTKDGAKTLVLAMSEPSSALACSRLFAGIPHIYKIASERTLSTIFRRYFSKSAYDTMKLLDQLSKTSVEEEDAQSMLRKFVLSLMRHACYAGASDIAFSPSATKSGGDVRLKIDGVGQSFTFLPADIWSRVITHLVTTCGAQDKLAHGPVDRRFAFSDQDKVEFGEIVTRYGFRVILIQRNESDNTLVTIVMRILDQQADTAELGTLGFDPDTLKYIRDCKDRATGLFLVTGPTGSGKTTTLYATLNEIDPISRWVQSIENPIEYSRGLWMQFQTRQNSAKNDAKGGSDEAQGAHDLLKGLLRAAPDVILFGEIRKGDIAEQLVDAGNTGHLVFSTLHNNDAALAISRLRSFNLDMSAIASLLLGILAQRLVRTLCSCAQQDTRADTVSFLSNLNFLSGQDIKPRRAIGCINCHGTGFRGRRMVYELLRVTPRVRDLIESGSSPSQIAREGITEDRTLVGNALRLVAQGITSIDEVKKLGPLKEVSQP